MNGPNGFEDLVGRGYPYYDLMGRAAPQRDAVGAFPPYDYPLPYAMTYPQGFQVTGAWPCFPGAGPFPPAAPVAVASSDGMAGYGGYPQQGYPQMAGYPQGGGYPQMGLTVDAIGPGPGFGGFGAFNPLCGLGPPVAPFATQQLGEPLTLLRPRVPRGIFTEPMGFGCKCIAAGQSETFCVTAETLSKIIRLVIPSDVAFQLVVEDIRVGRECLISSGPVAAALFVEDATDALNVGTDTIQEGTDVCITLTNVSNSDVTVCPSGWWRVLRY